MTDTEDFLTATRAFYDTVAEDYAEHFPGVTLRTPLERAIFSAYAELVGPGGTVADLGCGPGRNTAHLAALGLSVLGLDLSESMLAIARREHPALRFEQGSMLELPLADGTLAGVVSWYSSIHTPLHELPKMFGEFHRVLAPGGHLLLAFQVGEKPRRHERPWGHSVALDFHRRRPDEMAELLTDAGFLLRSSTVREPDETFGESVAQAFLLTQKEG
ncbi:methyltransferase [Streptomyces fodineus]|uniref:Methyltransferase n=1 Tax=Streptomyces fodineus TaxID=1904616 RepID=A0A1D7YAV0_9ACTN|nr:class I SAM-dependent methyltransferase [Streptomyces fodineus]AOR32758.1 methyltransferase [Streptomyces fodineus]